MISAENKAIVAGAVEAVKQRHEAQATAKFQAGTAMAQAKLGLSKSNGKIPGKKPAAKKPVKTGADGGGSTPFGMKGGGATDPSAITPYLNSGDLMGLNDATTAFETANSNATAGYANAAANALKAKGDIERSRVANVSDANNDAAARGIYNSGIRTGNVGMANTDAARAQSENVGGLALAGAQALGQKTVAKDAAARYQQALIQKAAENGMALPVAPDQGVNVPGVATARKTSSKPRRRTR